MSRFSKDFIKRARRNRFKLLSRSGAALRLSVFRSERNIAVQLIDDTKRVTVCSLSSLSKGVRDKASNWSNKAGAFLLGQLMAKSISEQGISGKFVFDRGGYAYHGRVKALADGLRDGGLRF